MSLRSKAKQAVGHAMLSLLGWRKEGELPKHSRYVLIAAPHTSSWDFPLMIALAFVYDVDLRWMGKVELFESALGPMFRRLGGVPVIRSERRNMVGQMADLFRSREEFVLAVPAEGTRSYTDRWKSGFYHIAREAEVPIVLGFLDFGRRVGGLGPAVVPSGDLRADMDRIRAFYKPIQGRNPERFGPIRLREESTNDDSTPERSELSTPDASSLDHGEEPTTLSPDES